MDFKGQKLAEQLYHIITILFCVVGFFYGWVNADFEYAFYCWAAGAIIVMLVCIPDWPCFNRNPVQWNTVEAVSPKVAVKK